MSFWRLFALAIGLTLASCGGQTSAQEITTSSLPVAPFEQAKDVAEPVSEGAASVDEASENEATSTTTSTPESPETSAPLSPLSSQVVELPSALPERVLEGLDQPVGVQPSTISLASLGIDQAPIIPVGLEANGELEVPGADSVGWYRFGVGVDGGKGSAVLAAHIAYNGRDGVFRDLTKLNPGDTFEVERDGSPITYRVESVTDYGKYELPIEDLFRETGEERLVLITCGGDFNPSLRSYEDNTVVIAVPVSGL